MIAQRRRTERGLARLPGCMLAGVLCMFAFTLWAKGYVGVSDPPLRAGSQVWLFYALLLSGLFWLAARYGARPRAGMALLGLLFGAVNYFSTTLFAYDTWDFLSGAGAWGIALLCVLGQAFTMTAAFSLVCGWLESKAHVDVNPAAEHPGASVAGAGGAAGARDGAMEAGESQAGKPPFPAWVVSFAGGRLSAALARFPRCAAGCRRHRTLAAMAFLLVCWAPFLIVFFPGTIIWDMGEMLGMFYGLREMTTWHPVFTTWLFGGCVWLGRQISGDNLGAFLFTLLQTVGMAYALADALRVMRRFGLSRGWRIASLLFFGLTPIFGSFAQAVGKDTLYTAALLLFALRVMETLRFGAPRAGGLAAMALWALLASLLRSNGLYVVAGTAMLTVALGLRGRARLKVGATLAAAVAAAVLFTGVMLPALHVKDETASGLYSVCFQQSARTLRDHADTVTPAQYAAIDRVLDAANLPALYETNISDPVKFTFRQYGEGRAAETAALTAYRGEWLAMLREYPLTYLEAFVAGNSGYYAFTPKIDAARTYHNQGGIRFVFETYELGADPLYLHTTQIAWLAGAREGLAAYARGWRRVPLLELALLCPLYTWLLVAAGYSLARRKRWKELIAFAPALLSLGVCLLSPVNDYFRYFLPIVAMCLPLMGFSQSQAQRAARL